MLRMSFLEFFIYVHNWYMAYDKKIEKSQNFIMLRLLLYPDMVF